MNKAKRQRHLTFKYIYFLISALFLWSAASNRTQKELEISELKEIIETGKIPIEDDLNNYSQTVQDVLRPLARYATRPLKTIYFSVHGAGAKDGSSWENAYAEDKLKTAIDNAGKAANIIVPSEEAYLILIAGGTYPISTTLNMKENVIIAGGIDSNWNPATSTLDGLHATQVFSNSNINGRAILYGISITNGSAANSGAGMYNKKSSPTLVQVTFSNNEASKDGGGMANFRSSPTLVQVTFSNNKASEDGGGMHNFGSSSTLTQVIFSNNKASKDGGGVANTASSPTLKQVTFSENTAEGGGGMYNNNKSSPILEAVTFSENAAYQGGGMYNNNKSSPTLKQVTFSENTAYRGGGMYNNNKSSPTLKQVTFSNNKARWAGGGMHNDHKSSPILEAVTFSGNIAERDGGGMGNDESSPTLNQVTFSNNSATKNGGGMYNDNEGKIGPSISNSIFWGNTPNQIYMRNDSNKGNENLQIYYSILEGGSAGITSFDSSEGDPVNITSYGLVDTADIKLDSSLADNGGLVQTLALQNDSPAVNAGIYVRKSGDNYYYSEDASTWYSTLDGNGLSNKTTPPDTAVDLTATDARGYAIVGRPDLGAYEFGAKAP